ncbi:Aspartate/glutamate/uridylate kinase [Radiomyces spectabilis]|uniref:Aspartate/glutamate/uridylate kinase n=1 Tax=Radiomyces spectabilis TaxID=64574 RepID=UPI00221FDA53|nr:Aspartate/glutamate/uridylate kinase [Radiomyces spectabilis]KAI8375972.1 Aspartate/glutamate/uridylate kinase [Radiomyces spectabilis]
MAIVLVKLGGAAITEKRGVCQLNPALDILLTQVHTAYTKLSGQHHLVLIHGAGSFGHPQAKQYKLKEGWVSPPSSEKIIGFSHIRQTLMDLHLTLLKRLHALGVPVVGLSPFDYIETENGNDTPTDTFKTMSDRVHRYLQAGFVPLLHGDAVFDRVLGCTILSGDVIMQQLGVLLPNVIRCIFITDVQGIYDTDPKLCKEAKLIRHIRVSPTDACEDQLVVAVDGTVADVTGGIHGKVMWAKRIVLTSKQCDVPKDVIICKLGSKEAMLAMLLEPIFSSNDQPLDQNMTIFTLDESK